MIGITFVFTFRIHSIAVVNAVYFRNFSVSFLITYYYYYYYYCMIFMQDIYNYISETNHVSRVYSIAVIP